MLDTCIEALQYVQICLEKKEIEQLQGLLSDLHIVLEKMQEMLSVKDSMKREILFIKNMDFSLSKIGRFLHEHDLENATCVLRWELFPFSRQLKEDIIFNGYIYPYPEKRREYQLKQKEKMEKYTKKCHEDKNYKYEASIVVTAYNQLAYTKAAIESIFEYTDFSSGKYELITVNNGSTDGTEEYFNSLPHVKKINLKYNILGNTTVHDVIEGKFVVGFSNDVVATRNWLDQLLACISSDPNIVWVTPTCNEDGISNGQGIKTPYVNSIDSLKEIKKFASSYNKGSKPYLWEEKTRLMPFVAIMPSKLLLYWEGIDRTYKDGFFADDDMSVLFRRSGLKQVLAKDTFLHHFGSVTLKTNESSKKKASKMKEVFFQKWGVDAWEAIGDPWELTYHLDAISFLQSNCREKLKVLLFEPKFGNSFLDIKNYFSYNRRGIEQITAVLQDELFIEDAKGLGMEVVFSSTFIEEFDFKSLGKYDYISAGVYLEELFSKDYIAFLEKVYDCLKQNGVMLFVIKNFRSADVLIELMCHGNLKKYEKNFKGFSGIGIEALQKKMSQHAYLKHADFIIGKGNLQYSQELAGKVSELLNLEEDTRRALEEIFNTSYASFSLVKK